MKLTVSVKTRSNKEESWVEGHFQLPNSTPSKLTRKDGCTRFNNVSTLKQSARKFGDSINAEIDFNEPAKKAAKKSVRRTPSRKVSAN